ncbi:Hsp70 family protein [Rutstroemia sp. NJR-2017a BBW]|nr:Hsp70 family protein [Rutstroemia sp. NJR-2017a BBW]
MTTALASKLSLFDLKETRHKIIVGIDYGTTFSGVSYVTTDKTGIDDITVISKWPGDSHASWKTPTRIAYSRENPRLLNNKWGFEVNAKLTSYSWTKLLLDKNAAPGEHDDPALSDMAGAGMLKLPSFRDATGVCEDFLRGVYTYVSGMLRQQMTDLTFENTPMECWITLPAVWSEEAKDATLRAAKNAGFGKRADDEVFTIAEPEAAAIATLKEYAKQGAMNPLKILALKADTQVGGKCGSTYIDRNLHSLLSKRFGSAFDDLDFGQKGPGSKFMACFEMLKRDFGHNDDEEERELGPLNLGLPDSEYYDSNDMQSLFDPVVGEIIGLLEQQVEEAMDSQNSTINVTRKLLRKTERGEPY